MPINARFFHILFVDPCDDKYVAVVEVRPSTHRRQQQPPGCVCGCAGPRTQNFAPASVTFACSTPARVSHASHSPLHPTRTATHRPHGLTPPPRPHFSLAPYGLRRVPSPTVVPTPLDAPSAAGAHPGLFGYLLLEISTLATSILALRFVCPSDLQRAVCVVGQTRVSVVCRCARRAHFCVVGDVSFVHL